MSHSAPYEAVLRELRAQREDIDAAIKAMEKVRGFFHRSDVTAAHVMADAAVTTAKALTSHSREETAGDHSNPQDDDPNAGPFTGRTIYEAAIMALAQNGQPMPNMELTDAIQRGGLKLNAADVYNTVSSVLTRRFYDHGDIVRVGRGVWGLPEWYPGQDYRAEAIAKRDGKLAAQKTAVFTADSLLAGNIDTKIIEDTIRNINNSQHIMPKQALLNAGVSGPLLSDLLIKNNKI